MKTFLLLSLCWFGFQETKPAAMEPPLPLEEAARLEAKHLTNLKQITFEGETGEGYFAPDGTKIIYQSIRGEHPFYQIYVLDLKTGVEKRISTGTGRTTCSFFHPTEPLIVFASSHLDPKLAEIKDAELKKLAAAKKNPQRRRSYEWAFDPELDIFQCDLDGRNLKRLTNTPGYDAEGSFSPDGKEILFCSFRKGNGDLYVMNADGSNVRQLTDNPGYDGGPFFSADGKKILYRAEAGKPDYLQIFTMDRDGSHRQQLTNNDAVNWGPYFHPNGKDVIFSTSLHGHYNYELYLLDAESKKLERVTYTMGADILPVFDKTGTKVMWTSKRGKNKSGELSSQLWMADWKKVP